ncbi:hypothetical protein GP486_004554 [Trichoglossum hirsutum]|uniref:Calpain catalytic domain-containing protein n=1 Tax=Trichoglossum hirsutum TaxID=265104 RepID=A0A9P8LAY1_9PEZI|nr:hypothetical protein GP486_004554 [Trichoglossum hirsutum]
MADQPLVDRPIDPPPPVAADAETPADPPPENLYIGAINPRALTEAILGKKIDWSDPASTKIMTDTLETNYNELFDMKFNSPIFAGLKLDPNNMAVPAPREQMRILTPENRVTPSLGAIRNLGDLKTVGIDDLASVEVNHAVANNGKLTLSLEAPPVLNNKITNTSLTQKIFDIATTFGAGLQGPNVGWTLPGTTWRDMGTMLSTAADYDDPIQGSIADCWLISAMAAVAWADPYSIVHRNRPGSDVETDSINGIQFYSKPTGRNAPTKMIEVTDKTLVDNQSLRPPYSRCEDRGEIWPQVYEKAFAKWSTQDTTDQPNMTSLAYGDPGWAMAQINNKTAYYYYTDSSTPDQLWGIVRGNSVSYRTINPMTAWTYGSGPDYDGSNIVANHAYTILGWANRSGKEYIVLRNPWGYHEPHGLNTYQGLLQFFDSSFWLPIDMIKEDGVFALEAPSFKYYFAAMAVAK